MGPATRKTVLLIHVLSSVGWFGAVGALAGLASTEPRLVEGVYLAAQLITWWVIVPMGVLAFVSGIVQSIGTPWGLLRYWWVLFKLVLTSGALVVLFLHTGAVDTAAVHLGADGMSGMGDLEQVRLQLVVDSAAAAAVLAITTLLSVVKPRGETPFRRRAR
jgi:hypothetical protein